MTRRSSEGWSGAFLFIAMLGFLGPACGLVVGSETIISEPLDEGGISASGSGNGGGNGGGNGSGGGGSGGGGASCCDSVKAVTFTKAGTQYFSGTTTEGVSSVAPEVKFGCKKADGPELVYAVTYEPGADVDPKAFLTASIKRSSATFDSVLYAKKNCCAGPTELCADSTAGAGSLFGGEVISIPVSSGDTWYIFVDGVDADDQGSFELDLNVSYGWSCVSEDYYIPVPLELGGTMTLKGTTEIENETNGCGGLGGSWIGWGSSVVYALSFAPPVQGVNITLTDTDLQASNDTLFYIRPKCVTQSSWQMSYYEDEITCVDYDETKGITGEAYSLSLTGRTSPVFLFADVGQGDEGPFNLTLTPH